MTGASFTARAASLGKGAYGTEVTVPFARPLPLYLRLGRQTKWYELEKRFAAYPDAWSEWVQAKKTGHRDFDHEFRVVATNAELENAVLNDAVRAALLDLTHTYEHVHMTTDCISVRTNELVPPAQIEEIAQRLVPIES